MRAASDDVLPRWFAAAALAALAVWTFWDRWSFLAASPLPTGVDGFWYPVQLRSLLDGDGLYYPAAPLTLYLMAPLAWLTDPITGAKLGAALAGAALPLTTYLVGRRVGGERAGGLLAATLVATSAGSFYLSTEFVKNAVALSIGMGAIAAAARAIDAPTRGRVAIAALLLLATAAAHELVLAFALVAILPPLALRLLRAESPAARRRLIAAAAALLLALVALVALESHLLARVFSASPDWSFAALRIGARTLAFRHEVAIAAVAGALAVALAIATRRVSPLAVGPAVWAIAIALPWLDITDADALPFRLRLMAFAPLALAAAAVLAAAAARVSPTARMTATMLIAGLALYRPGRYQAPVVHADPDLAAAVAAARGHLAQDDIVVSPERHLVFMNVWYSGVETRLHPGDDTDWRLVPMAYMSETLQRAIDDARAAPGVAPPIGLHRGNRNGLVLLPEATWRWILGRLSPPERAYYAAWPVH